MSNFLLSLEQKVGTMIFCQSSSLVSRRFSKIIIDITFTYISIAVFVRLDHFEGGQFSVMVKSVLLKFDQLSQDLQCLRSDMRLEKL